MSATKRCSFFATLDWYSSLPRLRSTKFHKLNVRSRREIAPAIIATHRSIVLDLFSMEYRIDCVNRTYMDKTTEHQSSNFIWVSMQWTLWSYANSIISRPATLLRSSSNCRDVWSAPLSLAMRDVLFVTRCLRFFLTFVLKSMFMPSKPLYLVKSCDFSPSSCIFTAVGPQDSSLNCLVNANCY